MYNCNLPENICEGSIDINIIMAPGCIDLFPKKAHEDDAGWDLCSKIQSTVIEPGKTKLILTGVFIELPRLYEAQIRSRSGLAYKNNIAVLNSPGTIDCGYRGEIGVILTNFSSQPLEIKRGDRIAQMVICKLPSINLNNSDKLSSSSRGDKGFGSSGI